MHINIVEYFKGNANGRGLLRIDMLRGPLQGQTVATATRDKEAILSRMAAAYNATLHMTDAELQALSLVVLKKNNA
jgi:hypothetical protein